jgi:hypothetical protein
MKVWAKTEHRYWDADCQLWRRIPAGEWRELPDGLAKAEIAAHPDNLSLVKPTAIRTVVMSGPPAHRQMKVR